MMSAVYRRRRSIRDVRRLATEVHVWCIELDLPEGEVRRLARMLSPAEQLRANRFYFEHDRRRFIASHGLLRVILASYLDLQPAQLEFSFGVRGKPALTNTFAGRRLCFNMSHSNAAAICAISCNRAVGVDLEHLRLLPDMVQLAQRFFSPREYERMQSFDPALQAAFFFQLWTCKEAYLKATGEGLAGLEQVEIELSYRDHFMPVGLHAGYRDVQRWSLRSLSPPSGHTAALAVEGTDLDLIQRQWKL